MASRSSADGSRLLVTAMLCSATVTGQLVAGRALRDALFLTALGVAALPPMMVATSAVSLLLVWTHERRLRTTPASTLLPRYFALSGGLFLLEWAIRPAAPAASAVVLYLHISAVGPLLASSFSTVAAERFDARAMTRRVAPAAIVGAVGAALLAERMGAWSGAPSLLPMLAAFQGTSAALLRRILPSPARCGPDPDLPWTPVTANSHREPLRAAARFGWVRHLAAIAFLGAAAPALVEYLFKAEALETFGRGDQLLRFFALYYAGTSLTTFLLHALSSDAVVERFGVRVAARAPSAAVIVAGTAAIFVPGLASLAAACASASALRGSWLREALERLFGALPTTRIHAARTSVEVVADRVGAAAAGALLIVAIAVAPAVPAWVVLGAAILCSVGVITIASTLRDPVLDAPVPADAALDPEALDMRAIRAGDRAAIAQIAARPDGVARSLVPHLVGALADDRCADAASAVLRAAADVHAGQLVDVLLDAREDVCIRRRVAQVLSAAPSQRTAGGLVAALDDLRFAVRSAAARSLVAIRQADTSVHVDRHRVLDVLLKEVTVGRCVWDARTRPADVSDDRGDGPLRVRAGESLAHVFTLLSLIHPRETVQRAFAGLTSDDRCLRDAALDYVHGAVTESIRRCLWPLVGESADRPAVLTRSEAADVLGRGAPTLRSDAGETAGAI